ncbi:hypothetical protein AMTRI_Chr02g211920 [Amborella trichopoda]|uniref:TCP domain-containing protein n=1 Tax=Amborella trichopoda TaxID=13333 RepID=W1NQM0_AMBTC|nr:transcription factor TCP2 [Amborella trichopoda]XP_011620779.1 transcription factor TCP2 [Amborella trichopoda]ERM99216.1 hypothetical protein AMTR_s00092p00113360 [Amborella trichopoda]|eukprot:XP_011620778.1 transcription factor TCP2 [Amborella trichopoda]
MEPDDALIAQVSKRPKTSNGLFSKPVASKSKTKKPGHDHGATQEEEDAEEEEEEEETKASKQAFSHGGWPHHLHTSRIIRVSRQSGGKDRHSKVMTAKGLRDRRVRLSVSTAIQFYDLQDRLNYDQPSKAVEWLLKAASDAISELPSLQGSFPDKPSKPESSEPVSDPRSEPEAEPQGLNPLTGSGCCSSTSETSRGSVLSLSRSDLRVKARQRAKERTAKEKSRASVQNLSLNAEAHDNSGTSKSNNNSSNNNNGSFTDLLLDGNPSSISATHQQNPSFMQKLHHEYLNSYMSGPTMLNSSLIHPHRPQNPNSSSCLITTTQTQSTHLTNPSLSPPNSMTMAQFHQNPTNSSGFLGVDNQELQSFSFVQDHMAPVTSNDYNFSMPSLSSSGYHRGTLQSNSSPFTHLHFQRFSPSENSNTNVPFFIGTSAAAAAVAAVAASVDNQYQAGLDARLQLCYGDGYRHSSDLKGKGKR